MRSAAPTAVEQRLRAVRAAADTEDWPGVVLEAEELLDLDPDHPEALLFLANASLELGDPVNAAEAFAHHLEHAQPSADALSGLAVARFEACDIAGAVGAARAAVQAFPDLAEAHYTLGLALERTRGGATSAATHFAAANSLDPEAYPWPIPLDDKALEEALLEALRSIPRPLARFWSGVPMRLEEQPTLDELARGAVPIPPTVAGMYEGRPPDLDQGPEQAFEQRPKALRLFRRNLSRCGDLDQVIDQLEDLLVQEALDWLGLPLEAFEGPEA